MKRVLLGMVAAAVAAVSAHGQTRGQGGPGVEPLPELAAPAGAEILTRVSYGLRSTLAAGQELPSTGINYRLSGGPAIGATTDHYVARLTALGWKPTYRGLAPKLSLVRFSVGTAGDPRTGMLTVVPFETNGHTIVALRLVLSRAAWNFGRRPGGAGANANAGAVGVFSFRGQTDLLSLPEEVTRVEERSGGGPGDFKYAEARLQTTVAPAALMAMLQKQVAGPAWRRDAQLGDAAQNVVRRSRTSGAALSEVWMLTRMPGVLEVDAILLSVCAQPRANTTGRGSQSTVRPACGN